MINCVYIHIPFCEKKCNYCSFYSYSLLRRKEEYINALKKEINFYYKKEPLKTLYFGGGTPSLLDIKDIEEILALFNYNSKTEVSFEINPHKIDKNKLNNYKSNGINRLSIGVQNFNDKILAAIGRNHTKKDIFNTIENIKSTPFDNFSIDLIYGLPGQNLAQWIKTLDLTLELDIPHISLYGLKIEKGTYFYKFPPKDIANSDMQADMYKIACEKLKKRYLHYEFSNFAKNYKYISNHNCAYWKRLPYWGFGLSASGFINNKRYTNTFNFNSYIKNPVEKNYSLISTQNAIEEEIFLGLRLNKGINFREIEKKYRIDIFKKYKNEFEKFIDLNYMEKTMDGVKLTLDGVLISNEILCEFIEVF